MGRWEQGKLSPFLREGGREIEREWRRDRERERKKRESLLSSASLLFMSWGRGTGPEAEIRCSLGACCGLGLRTRPVCVC